MTGNDNMWRSSPVNDDDGGNILRLLSPAKTFSII